MLSNNVSKLLSKRFSIFILFGGLNTFVTYLLYLLLSAMMHYQVAYLIAYVSGIALAYVLNLRFVYNAESSLRKIISYPLVYVAQYFVGAVLMFLLLSVLHLPNALAPLLVVILLLPVTYFLNKKVLVG